LSCHVLLLLLPLQTKDTRQTQLSKKSFQNGLIDGFIFLLFTPKMLPNPPPMMMVPSPQLPGVLPLSSRRCGIASFAEFRGLRMQMGSKLSTSLVSIRTRRNPKVFSRIVSEAHETFVDSKFLFFN